MNRPLRYQPFLIIILLFVGLGAADAQSPDTARSRTVGILAGFVPGDSRIGLGHSDYLFGIYARKSYSPDFFGEARLSMGVARDNRRRTRLIPLEYRLNFRPVLHLSNTLSRKGALSPYLYMGAGLLYHKPIEAEPEPDPRTRRLDGSLPASSFFGFGSGLTPMFTLGGGLDIRLDPTMSLDLQIGTARLMNQISVSDGGYRDFYTDVSLGLQVRLAAPAGKKAPVRPLEPAEEEPPPEPPAEEQPADTAAAEAGQPDLAERTGIPVDTLSADCLFLGQLGSYGKLSNAIQVADSARAAAGRPFDIYYDTSRNLYTVRSRPETSMETALERVRGLRGLGNGDAALLHRCGEDRPGPIAYQLQFAAFADSMGAARYADRVKEEFDTKAVVVRPGQRGLFRVRSPAYNSLGAAREVLSRLRSQGAPEGIFLTMAEPVVSYAPRYGLFLQVDTYRDADQAASGVPEWRERGGLRLRILAYGAGGDSPGYLLVDRPENWGALLETRDALKAAVGDDLVIHLVEQGHE